MDQDQDAARQARRARDAEQRQARNASFTVDQRQVQQQEDAQQHRTAYADLSPELLQERQNQNADQMRTAYAALSPEQLQERKNQNAQQHMTAYAALSLEQRQLRQEQNAEQMRLSRLRLDFAMDEAPQVNDAREAFSIDMTSIPSGNQLNNHDLNVDKALLLFYENAYSPLHDHIHDLNHESNNESEDVPTRAEDRFLTSLDELKITSVKQREMQCKFNSIHDRKARIIGCCSCGISCTLPTVSSEGHLLPPPNLKDFPGHAMFRPLQFKAEELEEWNAQSSNQQMIRSTKLSATDGVRYHVHQELIIITPMQNEDDSITSTMKGYICKQCENYLSRRIVPMFSVAKLDLGLLSRVFEHELYPIEKLLVARH